MRLPSSIARAAISRTARSRRSASCSPTEKCASPITCSGPQSSSCAYTTERYWKELRVAVPSSAGGARLDRRVDVVQAALMAVAMFAGRPLRDTEHLSGHRRCADEHLGAAADPQLAASSAAHGSAARVRARRRSVAGADRGHERERADARLRAISICSSRGRCGSPRPRRRSRRRPHADHRCRGEAAPVARSGRRCADAEARRVAGARCRSAQLCAAGRDRRQQDASR